MSEITASIRERLGSVLAALAIAALLPSLVVAAFVVRDPVRSGAEMQAGATDTQRVIVAPRGGRIVPNELAFMTETPTPSPTAVPTPEDAALARRQSTMSNTSVGTETSRMGQLKLATAMRTVATMSSSV